MDFDESDFNNFIQIGKGSYGTVFGNQNIVFKLINLIAIDNDNHFAFIDNNIRELVFYKTIYYKNIIKDPNKNYTYSLIPDKKPHSISYHEHILLSKDNHTSKLIMKNLGIPLNKLSINPDTISSSKLKLSILKIDFLNVLIHQIGNALLYLHSSNFSHGDLKPNNILCNFDNYKLNFHLIDFGSICFNHSTKKHYKFHRTTILYCSPEECSLDHSYYKENDIWSFGCIIYELYTGTSFIKDLLKKDEGLTDQDAVPEAKLNAKSKLGDIWLLGKHKLMCGDSTTQDVLNLFKEQKADLYLTDPPYNVNYEGKTKDKLTIKNDKQDDETFKLFLTLNSFHRVRGHM
jgi:serine/threonine protein kinase